MDDADGRVTGGFWLVPRAGLLLALAFAALILLTLLFAVTLPHTGVLALESDRGGDWDIYLFDMDSRRFFNLTHVAGEEYAPAWSPDGARLAFHADRDGDGRAELYVIDADGRRLQALDVRAGHNWRPVWSPDGQALVFIRGFGGLLLVDLATRAERSLGEGFGPTWSPDGRYLVTYLDPDGRLNADLYLRNVMSGHVTSLTDTPLNEWSPAWSPDGASIAFTSARDSAFSEIYLLDAACIQAARLLSTCRNAIRRLTHNDVNDTSPAWSPDSRSLVAVADVAGATAIYWIDAQTGESRLLLGGDGSNYQHPAWQP